MAPITIIAAKKNGVLELYLPDVPVEISGLQIDTHTFNE